MRVDSGLALVKVLRLTQAVQQRKGSKQGPGHGAKFVRYHVNVYESAASCQMYHEIWSSYQSTSQAHVQVLENLIVRCAGEPVLLLLLAGECTHLQPRQTMTIAKRSLFNNL